MPLPAPTRPGHYDECADSTRTYHLTTLVQFYIPTIAPFKKIDRFQSLLISKCFHVGASPQDSPQVLLTCQLFTVWYQI